VIFFKCDANNERHTYASPNACVNNWKQQTVIGGYVKAAVLLRQGLTKRKSCSLMHVWHALLRSVAKPELNNVAAGQVLVLLSWCLYNQPTDPNSVYSQNCASKRGARLKCKPHIRKPIKSDLQFMWIIWCNTPIPVTARSAAVRFLGLGVRIPPEAWMSVSCECCVLWSRGLCVGVTTCQRNMVCLSMITRPRKGRL
jgi:hypothetical protein